MRGHHRWRLMTGFDDSWVGSVTRLHPLQRPKFGELLDAASAIPAQRKARRECANRINALAATIGP
jgi:hypothetical protein